MKADPFHGCVMQGNQKSRRWIEYLHWMLWRVPRRNWPHWLFSSLKKTQPHAFVWNNAGLTQYLSGICTRYHPWKNDSTWRRNDIFEIGREYWILPSPDCWGRSRWNWFYVFSLSILFRLQAVRIEKFGWDISTSIERLIDESHGAVHPRLFRRSP